MGIPKRVSLVCGNPKCACVKQAQRPQGRKYELFLPARTHYMRALASTEKPADATRSVLKRFEFRAADAPMYQARFLHRRLDDGGFDFHHYREYHTVRMHGSRSKRPPDCAVLTGRIDVLGVVSSVTEDYFVKRLVPGGVPEPSSASGPPDKWELVQVAPYFRSDASQFVIEVVEITSFTEAVPL